MYQVLQWGGGECITLVSLLGWLRSRVQGGRVHSTTCRFRGQTDLWPWKWAHIVSCCYSHGDRHTTRYIGWHHTYLALGGDTHFLCVWQMSSFVSFLFCLSLSLSLPPSLSLSLSVAPENQQQAHLLICNLDRANGNGYSIKTFKQKLVVSP